MMHRRGVSGRWEEAREPGRAHAASCSRLQQATWRHDEVRPEVKQRRSCDQRSMEALGIAQGTTQLAPVSRQRLTSRDLLQRVNNKTSELEGVTTAEHSRAWALTLPQPVLLKKYVAYVLCTDVWVVSCHLVL